MRATPTCWRSCALPAGVEKKFFMVSAFPVPGEKLALVLTLYRAKNFERAAESPRARSLDFQGRGRPLARPGTRPSAGAQARRDQETDVVRVLINQAHTSKRGRFDSGLLGRQLHHRQPQLQELHRRRPLGHHHPEDRPSEEQLFGAYWAKYPENNRFEEHAAKALVLAPAGIARCRAACCA